MKVRGIVLSSHFASGSGSRSAPPGSSDLPKDKSQEQNESLTARSIRFLLSALLSAPATIASKASLFRPGRQHRGSTGWASQAADYWQKVLLNTRAS